MIPSARMPVSGLSRSRQFDEAGFLIIPAVLSPVQCDTLSAELAELFRRQQETSHKTMGGLRNVLKISPHARSVGNSPELISLVNDLTNQQSFPVRGTLFDKQSGANWSVPWHQDLAITVAERIDTPGFGPWSVKDEVVHVQPPPHILVSMITVRLHLDACSVDNGALRVIPGSHRDGELSSEEIAAWVNRDEPVVCDVPRGGALVMRPLLLHASSPAETPSHRRVLHIEYASETLPNGLKWFEQT